MTTSTQSWLVVDLHSRPRQFIFLLAITVPAVICAAITVRIALAQSLADTLDVAKVQYAIRLDPAMPEFHNKLGLLYLAGQSGTAQDAVQELQRAVDLNPNVARYWSWLAKGCYVAGDQSCADHAYQRATELAPSKPLYTWEAAVNHVLAGRRVEAATYAGRFVRLQPDRAGEAFYLLEGGFHDYEFIWHEVVRSSGDLKVSMAFLAFLTQRTQYDVAARYWQELISTKSDLSFLQAKPYLECLLAAGRYREARDVWNYLLETRSIQRPRDYSKENLIFNGGFEQLPLEAGFDWRCQQQIYMSVNLDDRNAHTGSYALRVDFTAPSNSEYEPIHELVPVIPGQAYTVRAYVRSNKITSDSGPRLRIVDPNCPTCLSIASDGVTGTTEWHSLEVSFTSSQTEVVRISVWRPRSRSFPMEITGQFWIDDVVLHQGAMGGPVSDTPAANTSSRLP